MMKNKYILFLVCGLLSFSSCIDEEQAGVPEGREISLDFSVSVSAMQAAGDGPDTRSAMSAEEKAIHSLYVVQFNGTEPTSTVVKSGLAAGPGTDGKVGYGFTATGGDCRVYVVANVNPGVTVNATTLGDFEKSLAAFSPTQTIPAAGLPMCGYKDFNPATVTTAPGITLTAMVAKLVVRYDLGNSALFKAGTSKITLKNAAAGTTYGTSAASAQGSLSVDNLALGTTYTFYVAENRAGTNPAVTEWEERTLARIPSGSRPLYFEIRGKAPDNSHVSIVSLIGDPSKPEEFNIYRNTCYTLTATINSFKADERVTVSTMLDSIATANCYMVMTGANRSYAFDATKPGNNSDVSGITKPTNLTNATEARVLWQTGGPVGSDSAVIKWVEYDKAEGIVRFTTGNATEGNAVIGIFENNSSNSCLWSWHIWRLRSSSWGLDLFSKTSATTGKRTSVIMMNLNLGAYNNTPGDPGSIGLLYQWGRKDPFPGPAGFDNSEPNNIYDKIGGSFNGPYTVPTISQTFLFTPTVENMIAFPMHFVLEVKNNDWLSTKNDNLWGTPWEAGGVDGYNKNQGTKTIYDPCPPMFRVPPQDTWNLLANEEYLWQDNGVSFPSIYKCWFPNAGVRDSNDGALFSSPNYGYYWSSSPDASGSIYASYLNFHTSAPINPRNMYYRAAACSVRCVLED